jgi:F-type H+-transporting ATPase subunit epsilon
MAVPLDDFDRSVLASQIKDAEEDVADASEDWQRDKLAHKLEQLKALQAALGH